MNIPADQLSGLAPALRDFLAEPADDEAWSAPAGQAILAESELQVGESQLGQAPSRFIRQGGVRLNRVTHRLLLPDELPAITSHRPDLKNIKLILARFWLMFDELPPKHRYTAIRIRIKLHPFVPVMLLSPDRTGDTVRAATAIDLGTDGFGWNYEAHDAAPLIPHRLTTLVILELPATVTEIAGLLDTEAQINRSVLGEVLSMKASPVNSAAPFLLSLDEAAEQDGADRSSRRQTAVSAHSETAARARDTSRDLGLIIPLSEEFDCAREILAFDQGVIKDNGDYIYPFSVPGSSLRGVAVVLFGMGPGLSAAVATSLLDRFAIRVLALMGIAGGLDRDLRLGDVVIASSIDEYFHRAKARPDAKGEGFVFESGGSVWRAGRDVVTFANNFPNLASQREVPDWRARGKRRREVIGLPGDGTLARDEPAYVVEPIASGEVVSASAGFSRWLRENHRQCTAIEMEAGGVAEAVYLHGRTELIVIRGICDFADERKAELDSAASTMAASKADRGAWRRYAGLNAADLLATMLRSPDFPGLGVQR
jgi:nucleoside phosphorylase